MARRVLSDQNPREKFWCTSYNGIKSQVTRNAKILNFKSYWKIEYRKLCLLKKMTATLKICIKEIKENFKMKRGVLEMMFYHQMLSKLCP